VIGWRAALAMQWRRRVAAAAACAFAGALTAIAGRQLPALLSAALLGAGILGASLLLAWAADALEVDVSGRLVIMVVTLVAVLPEATVEVQLAFTRQAELVTANLTGATRLLLTAAIAMPALGATLLRSRGQPVPPFAPNPARRLDLAVLALAAILALTLVARGKLTLTAGVIFGALYLMYVLRGRGAEDEPPATIGVAAQIAALDPATRRRLCGALLTGAAVAAFMTARAFPAELLRAGQSLGISPYLLIQSVIPLFTETPELVVAITLTTHRRPAQGVGLLLASAVTQSTLVLASVSVAYLLGGGGPALPLSGRGQVEMLLTAATILMAVGALASLKPEPVDGWIITAAFGLQSVFTSWQARLFVALALLTFAADILLSERRFMRATFRAALPQSLRALTSNQDPSEPTGSEAK
jgi:cation:H+ antiporter